MLLKLFLLFNAISVGHIIFQNHYNLNLWEDAVMFYYLFKLYVPLFFVTAVMTAGLAWPGPGPVRPGRMVL